MALRLLMTELPIANADAITKPTAKNGTCQHGCQGIRGVAAAYAVERIGPTNAANMFIEMFLGTKVMVKGKEDKST